MSSIKRALSGDVLVVDLGGLAQEAAGTVAPGGRSARTLLKSGPLRVAQVVLPPGATVAEHEAEGTITVQPLEGRIRFTAAGAAHELGPGQLLSLGPGIRHAVTSDGGATFLLTVATAQAGPRSEASSGEARPSETDHGGTVAAPEAWLRGAVEGVPPLLMPVAHALIQAGEDLRRAVDGLSLADLSSRLGGAASIAFHLRHIAGSLDRLFTYARGEALTPEQRAAIKRESAEGETASAAGELLELTDAAIARSLAALRATPEAALLERRLVGRAELPSNVVGLFFHAAEHAQRHTGQVVTTARIVRAAGLTT